MPASVSMSISISTSTLVSLAGSGENPGAPLEASERIWANYCMAMMLDSSLGDSYPRAVPAAFAA